MKFISRKYVNLGFILIVLSGITLAGGFIKWPLFFIAAIFILSYIVLDRKKLRCPNCGGFENLDRLMYAKNHVFHCMHCGEKINIK